MANEIIVTEETNQGTGAIIHSTITADSLDAKRKIVNALGSSDTLKDMTETPLKVVGIIVTEGMRKARQSGEHDTPCQNTYLVTADGKSYMTQSDGIARSANMICAMYTSDELAQGVDMMVRSRELPNGNTIKSLEIL